MTRIYKIETVTGISFTTSYIVTGEGLTLKQAHDAALHDARQFEADGDHPRVKSIKEIYPTVLTVPATKTEASGSSPD